VDVELVTEEVDVVCSVNLVELELVVLDAGVVELVALDVLEDE
jgi:hypothetical protein